MSCYRHGLSHTREYRIWMGIRARCLRPHDPAYHLYGGRGIGMCRQWKDNVRQFYKDMGPCPKGHEIDRINNNKGYFPSNCRWTTKSENSSNRRNGCFVRYQGQKLCVAQWARKIGLPYHTLIHRIKRKWPLKKALRPVLYSTRGKIREVLSK